MCEREREVVRAYGEAEGEGEMEWDGMKIWGRCRLKLDLCP